MATFVMFGNYSYEGMQGMSSSRTDRVVNLIEDFGGKVKNMYALLGQNDLLFIVDFPSINDTMKASVAIDKATGIAFTTSPALGVNEFDKLMDEL
jgi:uncharacterized protein with GYD domain